MPFDVLTGSGVGTLDGIPGATVSWTFSDAGEPGSADMASVQIKDAQGQVVLEIAGPLAPGNHQAQMQ